MIALVAAAVAPTQLSCVVVDAKGASAQFEIVRNNGTLSIVPADSKSWPDGIIGVSRIQRAEKRQAARPTEEYRVQTRDGQYVVGLTSPNQEAPTLVTIEKDDFGTPALNPTVYEGICANPTSPKQVPPALPPAAPVASIGHAVRPITMQNTAFQTQCRVVTRELTVSSFGLKTALRPAAVTLQAQGSQAIPTIDVTGASLAGIASPLSDESRKILRIFNSAGSSGPLKVQSQISGENGRLTQTLEISQVAAGDDTLIAAGMCKFPTNSPAERG